MEKNKTAQNAKVENVFYTERTTNKVLEALKYINPLKTKKIRHLVTGLAVAAAFLTTPEILEGKKIEKISISERIPTPSVEEIESWIREAKPVVENAYFQASAYAGSIAELLPSIYTSNNTPVETPALTPVVTPQAQSVETKKFIPLVEEVPTSQAFNIAPTPSAIGSEVTETAFKDFSFEKKPSLERPFDHSSTNNTFEKMGLKMEDLMQPNPSKFQNFDALTNPSVEVLPIFNESVTRWSETVNKYTEKYNKANPDFPVSNNLVLALMTLESDGKEDAVSHTGAIGLMQLTSVIYTKYYGLNASQIRDPETNIAVAVSYLGEIIKYNKNLGYSNLNEQYFRAMEYNGGEQAALNIIEGSGSLASDETKHYGDNFLRFVVIGEIAQDLRDEGFTDLEISKLLTSSFYDKRIDEARKLKHGLRAKGNLNYETSKKILIQKAQEENPAGIVTQILDVNELEKSDQDLKSNPALTTLKGYVYI